MKLVAVLAGLALGGTAMAQTAKFPFPRNASYPNGIKAANANASDIQSAFATWKSNQYVEGACHDGTECARIKFDDPSFSVSEGIAYGLMIMVYMDNPTNSTQDEFDKLWNYYKASMNSRGLMNWKISGFSTNGCSGNNCNGATDAELDAALALMMASKQWGDGSTDKYFTAAKTLIGNVYKYEVASGLLGPGDGWGQSVSNWTDFYNPSYFSPAAVELFKKATGDGWSTVLTNNYALVGKNTAKSPTAGLPSNWCNANDGTATVGTTQIGFNYDAVRTPWRMALAFAWHGHADAKAIADKMANWAANSAPISGNPANVKDGYDQSGSATSQWNVATYVGALGAAGMVDAKYQTWVDNSYSRLKSGADGTGYYNSTLKVLYMLTLSGNMNNFWDGSAPPPAPSKFTVTTSATNGTIALSPVTGPYDSNLVVKATATPSAGYKFTGWTGACTGTGACNITMNANKTLGATFAAIPKFALATSATNGTISLAPMAASYDSGTVVSATAAPAAGYRFTGWSGACTGTGACSIAMNEAKTLTATFAPTPKYTLTTVAGNGAIALSPTGGSYDSNAVVTATATAPTGYTFGGWTGACTGTGACSITMKKDTTLGATWTLIPPTTYALTLTVGAGGKVVRSPDSATYSAGKVVILTARPDSAYKFSGWTGACSGSDSVCTVTMNAAKSVGATFTAIPFRTLSLNATNGTITTSPAGPKYAEGSTVTLTAVANSGYKFDKWNSSCVTSSGNTCSIVVPGYDNMWVGANFLAVPVGISRRLPNGERLLMTQGTLSFDATGMGYSRLELTDIQGRSLVLWQGQMEGVRDLSLQGVKAGVYFVHLQGQSGSFQKLVQILR